MHFIEPTLRLSECVSSILDVIVCDFLREKTRQRTAPGEMKCLLEFYLKKTTTPCGKNDTSYSLSSFSSNGTTKIK